MEGVVLPVAAITLHILDYYMRAGKTDWLEALRRFNARRDSEVAAAEERTASGRDSTRGPSLPLGRYAGTFSDPWYGDVEVLHANGGLRIRFTHTPSPEGDLLHWQYDTFVARWTDRELRADAFVTFSLNPDGSIDRVAMKACSPATDFSFDFQDLRLTPAGAHWNCPRDHAGGAAGQRRRCHFPRIGGGC